MQTSILSIRLLGALDLRYGDRRLPPLESARAESLLAYLLLHREAPQSAPASRVPALARLDRGAGADKSPPCAPQPAARAAGRRPLPRRDAAHAPVAGGRPFWLDVAAFEDALARARRRHRRTAAWPRCARPSRSYTGDLLDGCYDEWLLGERERLRQRYLEALERLADAPRRPRRPCSGDRATRSGSSSTTRSTRDVPAPHAAA